MNEVAKLFGGGGHKAAAGARIPGRPLSVQRRVVGGAEEKRSTPSTDIMQEFDLLDGALLIDKPAGPTSHDVVEEIRRAVSHQESRPLRHARSRTPPGCSSWSWAAARSFPNV